MRLKSFMFLILVFMISTPSQGTENLPTINPELLTKCNAGDGDVCYTIASPIFDRLFYKEVHYDLITQEEEYTYKPKELSLSFSEKKTVLELMEKACKFGNLSACQSILQTQSGVFIDYDNYQRIKKIREYACAAKGAKECMDLSKQYKRGEGVRFSEEKSDEYRKLAILHYKERCASKDGKSCFELANFHLLYKDVFENLEEMVEHYGLACDFGYQPGCEQYKYFMDYKSYDNSEKTNKSWFGKLFSSP